MSAVRTDLIKAAHEALDAEAEKAKAPAGRPRPAVIPP
jgi:hypothetical protein